MTAQRSCIYTGVVVHKRLTPRRHAFAYRVFTLLLDVDEIDGLAETLPLFSRNRFNLLSFYDRDHGRGDGTPVGAHARALLASAGLADAGARIQLLCYPRMFGFVFNPLSVYVCSGADGTMRALIYEVTNTFRERTSYIIPVEAGAGDIIAQACGKAMYVSPFTSAGGSYSFRVRGPGEDVLIAINFRDETGPVLKTHFRGARRALDHAATMRVLASYPMMTLKVIGGIHLEAARLWAKRIPLLRHQTAPRYSSRLVAPVSQRSLHA